MNQSVRLFVILQLALFTALGGAAVWRWLAMNDAGEIPPLRETPMTIEDTIEDHEQFRVVVTDEQLVQVLRRLRPKNQGDQTQINFVDHALRFWTTKADFGDSRFLSGAQMRALLTDQRFFDEVYGPNQDNLMVDRPTGVEFLVGAGKTRNSHVDHTMACLAEVGTPLSFPVFTAERETTYQSILEFALRAFSLNQLEYEWSALTFALFIDASPDTRWRTSEGQTISFDELARRIMRQKQPQGVCFGNHRLHGLCVILLVDQQTPILTAPVRGEIVEYLRSMSVRLIEHQNEQGFWNSDWPNTTPGDDPTSTDGDSLSDRLLATGHALEWWAFAPAEVRPPRPVLAKAGQWVVKSILELTDDQIDQMYPFLTHAGRALAVWHGTAPADVKLD